MANRRVSSRTRKVATKIAAAGSFRNDNGATEVVDLSGDEEASLGEEDDLVSLGYAL
ncbi:hypothetical protein Bca52824_046798 [Brassica carinata]|uniref:Uncharacterized protein n=1 Tax=Brassica carinata TaxID=52824 RepID=A0A8X7RDM1_BRACI|nr:hypothetical protein Bca52824_046798 [Brassica carinata]